MTIKVYSWDDDEQEVFGFDVTLPDEAVLRNLTPRQTAILAEDAVLRLCPGFEEGVYHGRDAIRTYGDGVANLTIVLDGTMGRTQTHLYVNTQDFIAAKALAEKEFSAWDKRVNGS